MQRYFNDIANQKGGAIAGASVLVLNFSDLSTATIYSTNSAIPANVAINPLTSDVVGSFFFYAQNGHYQLSVTPQGGATVTLPDIILDDAIGNVANINGGVPGAVLYQVGTNQTGFTAAGASGQVMLSGGTGSPTFTNQANLSVGQAVAASTATLAINMVGGAAGVVPYQIGANVSGFSAAGTSGQVLVSGGTGSPTWVDQVGSAALAAVALAASTATYAISATKATFVQGTTSTSVQSAGIVGEFIRAQQATPGVVLGNGTAANITTATLLSGDYDAWGQGDFTPAATSGVTRIECGINTTSASLASQDTYGQTFWPLFTPGNVVLTQLVPQQRIAVAGTATVYLIGLAAFATSSMSGAGILNFRRRS